MPTSEEEKLRLYEIVWCLNKMHMVAFNAQIAIEMAENHLKNTLGFDERSLKQSSLKSVQEICIITSISERIQK